MGILNWSDLCNSERQGCVTQSCCPCSCVVLLRAVKGLLLYNIDSTAIRMDGTKYLVPFTLELELRAQKKEPSYWQGASSSRLFTMLGDAGLKHSLTCFHHTLIIYEWCVVSCGLKNGKQTRHVFQIKWTTHLKYVIHLWSNKNIIWGTYMIIYWGDLFVVKILFLFRIS